MICKGQSILPYHSDSAWFFVGSDLKPINTKTYSFIEPTANGCFIVKKGDKYSIVNKGGIELVKFDFVKIEYLDYLDLFFGNDGVKDWSIDAKGNKVAEPMPSGYVGRLDDFSSSFHAFKVNEKTKVYVVKRIDKTIVRDTLPYEFDEVKENFHQTLFVKINGNWGAIDKNGNVILEMKYQLIRLNNCVNAKSTCEAVIGLNNLYGYVDENAKILIQPKYKSAAEFAFGYALVVCTNGKMGYVLRTGKELFK